ncbi:MAG: sodium-independent anion transporter [Methanobacteriota archaeon]
MILDMITSPIIDVSVSDMLGDFYQDLTSAGIQLRIAEPTRQVRRMLRLSGVEETIGVEVTQTTSREAVISDWNYSNPRNSVCLTSPVDNESDIR